jgi:hypothetical protein
MYTGIVCMLVTERKIMFFSSSETPLLRKRWVLANVPALLRDHVDSVALAGRLQDFWADALRLWGYQSFGGELPLHSHVAVPPPLLPASASPRTSPALSHSEWAIEGTKVLKSR